jgi:hypothetical protein
MPRKKQPEVNFVANLHRSAAAKAAAAPTTGQANRIGKQAVTVFFPQDVKIQLRVLGATKQQTLQRMLAEALNDFFVKNGLPEMAPLDE